MRKMTVKLEAAAVDELKKAIGAANRSDAIRFAVDVALTGQRLSVLAAVDLDVTEISEDDEDLAKSGLAAAALALAREIDAADTPASAKASCVARLREVLEDLRKEALSRKLEQLREQSRRDPKTDDPPPPTRLDTIRNDRARRRSARGADA